MAPLTEFHASIADVTNDQHQNMEGLVKPDNFNAEVVVRFLRANGIDARVDETTGGFRYTATDPARASDVLFACVCLRASISYAIEATLLVPQGKAMISKRSSSPGAKRFNRHHRLAPVEPLSARVFRLRIALGYSACELATVAGILACTVQRLESGKSVEKRVLPALANALGVPLCRLVCGEHSCIKRACRRPWSTTAPQRRQC